MYQSRINKLAETMKSHDIRAVAISAGPMLEYFSGLSFHISERPAVLIFKVDECPALIFPRFEKRKAEHANIKMQLYPYEEDHDSMINGFHDALTLLKINHIVGIEPQSFRFLEMDYMQKAVPKLIFISASEVFEQIFICKDKKEIEAIQKAVDIAESALTKTIPIFSEGISEREIANQLVINLLNCGSDSLIPFVPIIASGPNSANPHAVASDRQIRKGDLVIIDWGARFNGYVSDITRTFAFGQLDKQLLEMAQIVLEANNLARKSIRAGGKANEIDNAARNHIENSGYGDYFLHRTGHGIGLREHETPYISQSNTTIIKKGMVFTIEPGIYIAGHGGIRIEDDVVVTETGSITLTSLPREIVYL